MYPGSFIWKWIDNSWLVSKSASALFAAAGFVIVAMTWVVFSDTINHPSGPVANVILGVGGVLGALGAVFLWGGMWRYWIECDSSTVAARRFWFVVLAAGLWYGAMLYYATVYLPATRQSRA